MIKSQQVYAKVDGEVLLKVPESLYIPPDALKIFLEQFQGPLDLLLYLIRKKSLNILEIDVLSVIKQYLEYIDAMQKLEIDISAEYLLMASTLAEIKSRMLLPRSDDGTEDDLDPQQQLLNKLKEYQQIQTAAQKIDMLQQKYRDFFDAGLAAPEFDNTPYLDCDLSYFIDLYQQIEISKDYEQNYSLDAAKLDNLQDRIQWLKQVMRKQSKVQISQLITENNFNSKQAVVVLVMAVLELEKNGFLETVQNTAYSEVYLLAQ